MINKRPYGQAVNKDQTHIYTWWDDGTVTRHETRLMNGMYWFGNDESVSPPPKHNLVDFWAFVASVHPSDPPAELSDPDRK